MTFLKCKRNTSDGIAEFYVHIYKQHTCELITINIPERSASMLWLPATVDCTRTPHTHTHQVQGVTFLCHAAPR